MLLSLSAFKAPALLVQACTLLFQQAPATPAELLPPGDGAPVRVEVGVYLLDLMAIDGADQSFRADAIVQAVWHDPRLADPARNEPRFLPIDFAWHPRIEIVNRRAVDRTLAEQLRVAPDGTVSYSQRFVGTFSSPMDLREFPLDRQRFFVQVAVGYAAVGEVIEVAPAQSELIVTGRSDELSISDWRIGAASVEVAPLVLSPRIEIPGVALSVEGRRQLRYYIVQLIVPLMMIVTMAWTVFWIDPGVIPTRIGTVVTTMLTLIAYRFALASLVPRLPYLTRLDWFMLGSTTLILATLLAMAASAYLKSQGRDQAVERIDRVGRIGFAAAAIAIWTLPWLF